VRNEVNEVVSVSILNYFRARKSEISQQIGILLALILFVGTFAAISPAFRSFTNIRNVSVNISFVWIIAFVFNLLMISGGVDLSVGSVMGFAACTMGAAIVQYNLPSYIGIIVGLISAILIGVVNGILITKLKLPPLLVTLGMLMLVRGLCYLVTKNFTIQLTEQFAGKIIVWLGNGRIFGIPLPIFVAFFVFILCFVIQSFTAMGRNVYAMGGNEMTARLAGIRVDRTQITLYILTAFCAGISGILLAGLLQSAQPIIGTGMEFRAITAILIGGTSLFGGRGNIIGTVLGAILVGVIFNIIVIFGFPFFATSVIEGSIIILAVLLDTQLQKRFTRMTKRARQAA